jgi:hypothetical protein
MKFLLKHKLRHNIALTFQSENSPRQILPLEAKTRANVRVFGGSGSWRVFRVGGPAPTAARGLALFSRRRPIRKQLGIPLVERVLSKSYNPA